MKCSKDAPYLFSALEEASFSKALYRDIGCAGRSGPYARSFVIPQPYENLSCPPESLCNGTVFCDLFEPYVPGCCK